MIGLLLTLTVALAGACGGSTDDPDVALSPQAEAGLDLIRTTGCSACHGSNGEGVEGLGPSFEGLAGGSVTLEGGSTVIADRAYLRQSITEPDAAIVAGYGLPMPAYELTADELESILDFLEELG